MLPVDYLSWNQSTSLVASEDGEPPSRLVVAGSVSDLARTRLEQAGWRVTADAGFAD
jgi:hypothetical protein